MRASPAFIRALTSCLVSAVANIVAFLQPLVIAVLLNTVQEEGVTSQNMGKLVWISSCKHNICLWT